MECPCARERRKHEGKQGQKLITMIQTGNEMCSSWETQREIQCLTRVHKF